MIKKKAASRTRLQNHKGAADFSVISTLHIQHPHQGIVGNGDDTLTRVTLWRSESMELSDIGSLQTCLFLHLTQRTLLSTILRPR